MSESKESRMEAVRHYHQRTKHRLDGFAAGPGRLDWATQPEPFRWYDGAPRVELPLVADGLEPLYRDLYQQNSITPQPLLLESIAALFELSLGLSAWKQSGDTRWALRCNPSSGNLHPTEGYAIVPNVGLLSAGIYHYLSRDHLLEQRCAFASSVLPSNKLLIGLSSIHWREAWKYGERAFRYCQLDCGHAMAAVRYAAAALGWSVRLLDGWGDEAISTLLGLDRVVDFTDAEHEQPDLMLLVETVPSNSAVLSSAQLLKAAEAGQWHGEANQLSPYHSNEWPEIDVVAEACLKPETSPL
ncbi:SagB/ThcOx family dehydrogenase, partial [Pseudomonadota bacterium]